MSKVKFLAKQTRLQIALIKVQTKLASFKEIAENEFHNVYDTLTEVQRDEYRALFDSWNWNDWHSLEDRLTDRINDNTSEYQDWHFNSKGWVSL